MNLKSKTMNLDYIRTFVITSQSKTMYEASKKMDVTPSYISRHIDGLEDSLNTKLIISGVKGQELKLTESGKYFYEKYEKIYNEILLTEKEYMENQQIDNCKITLGVCSDLEKGIVKNKILEFNKKFPKINMKIINDNTTNLIKKLTQFSIDIVIDKTYPNYDLKSQEIKTIDLYKSNYCLVYDSRYYNKLEIDINKVPLIAPIKESQERILINEYFDNKGVTPNIKFEVENSNIISYVKNGFGVGIVLKELIDDESLDYIDLDIESNICISYVNGNLTPSSREFLKLFDN